jgi:galactose mutarotase-like enzyme
MKTCSIKNEFYTITVSTLGAELISVKGADGFEYMWQAKEGDGFWDSHAPILFPACGRLLNQKYTLGGVEYAMDCHGFAKDSEFAIASKEGSHITMALSSNDATKNIYPFDFSLIVNYELRGKDIIFSTVITNKDKKVMPYMFGWHPGFALPCEGGVDIESYKLDLGVSELNWIPLQNGPFACPVSKKYEISDGAYHFNEKEIYSNDTMIFTGHKNTLKMSAEGASYSLDMSWSDNLPFLCIWKDEFNAAKFICLEPWSATPAGGTEPENFDTRKMQRLGAGEQETYTYTLKFTH